MCGSSGTLNLLDFCFEKILVSPITLPKEILLLRFDGISGLSDAFDRVMVRTLARVARAK